MRFRTNYNVRHEETGDYIMLYPEYNTGESMTVPNQAMSVQEIMLKHARGVPVPRTQNMFYSGDQLYPNIKAMTEMDVTDMLRKNEERMKELDAELDKKRAKRKAAIEAAKKAKAKKPDSNVTDADVLDERSESTQDES